MLVDTHCHIHEPSYPIGSDEVLRRAHAAGVEQLICVGTSEKSSREAVEFATAHPGVFASVGVHPHDTKDGWSGIGEIFHERASKANPAPTPLPSLNTANLRHDSTRDVSLQSAELATAQTSSPGQETSRVETGQITGVSLPEGSVEAAAQSEGAASAQQVSSPAMELSSRSLTSITKYLQPESKATSGPDFSPGAKPFRDTSERRGDQNSTSDRGDQYNNSADQTSIIVAIGEIGLDYFYTHSPRETQIKALEEQIELAQKYNLPIIFHVREAFDDFWPIFDNFHGLRGVLHSFTDTQQHMEEALKRDLYIGVNGISTFTRSSSQKVMFSHIPLEKLLLETDAPFLTPAPLRGSINEPAFVKHIAEYHAKIRGLSLEEIAAATTANARAVFALR